MSNPVQVLAEFEALSKLLQGPEQTVSPVHALYVAPALPCQSAGRDGGPQDASGSSASGPRGGAAAANPAGVGPQDLLNVKVPAPKGPWAAHKSPLKCSDTVTCQGHEAGEPGAGHTADCSGPRGQGQGQRWGW